MTDWGLPALARRPGLSRLIALDALAAVGFTIMPLVVAFKPMPTLIPGSWAPTWVGWLIAAGPGMPVVLRRLWPAPVFGVVLTISVVAVFFGMVRTSFVAAAFVLYMVAVTQPQRRWIPTRFIAVFSAVGVLAFSVVGIPYGWTVILGQLLFGLVIMCGSWTVGRSVRERRAYAARAAEQLADRAVSEERLRIARELHDVVAHSMSLIAVKAGVANHVMDVRPGEARSALRIIEATSRTALTEMRRMLGVLRSDENAAEASGGLDAAPGVAGLAGLTRQAQLAGIHVEMDVHGVADIPDGVGLSVYRIVQESLTNVVRHAGSATCHVSVRGDGRAVKIEVIDDGPGTRASGGTGHAVGHGLIGMRERVTTYGGTFTAGPRSEGGFMVTARIPYEPLGQPIGKIQ